MSLLTKFSNVNIDHSKSLLKGEDFEICSKIEKDYLGAFSFYETEIEFFEINRENNQFLDFDGSINGVMGCVEVLATNFVEKIVHHFVGKYKITIKEDDVKQKVIPNNDYYIKEREKKKNVSPIDRIQKFKFSMSKILEEIQNKLGGLSLDEVGEKELKDKFYNGFAKTWSRDHSPAVELSKDKIKFVRGIHFESTYNPGKIRINYHSQENTNTFFRTLSYFENKSKEILPEFSFESFKDYDESYILSEIEFGMEKIKSVRFYKNQKIILKFQNAESAETFYQDFCRNGIYIEE